jgi:hypothetical protein
MRHPAKSLRLPAAVLVLTFLTAGCGSTASSVLSNVPTPSRTAATSAAPTKTATGAAPAKTATSAAPTKTATSAAPTKTATTAPPATVTVTSSPTTVKPSSPSPATSAAPASPATSPTGGNGSGTSLLWLWILLAVAALAGLITWIAHSTRRRSADAASWRSRLIDAYAKGSALHDAMSVAETLGAAGDPGARWADVQRRADDLTQTLYALREVAPDAADQDRIADVLVSLQAVRSAMEAERAPGGAGPQQARVVSDRLYAFESSLRALRDSGQAGAR